MFCSVLSAAVSGMEVVPVQVEADVSDGMPSFHMVGFVSVQVREAEDRVRTALRNVGIVLPPKRITINLSPADIRKEGTRFDLPIAAAVLLALGRLPAGSLDRTMLLGELGLDGHILGVTGVFPTVLLARELSCVNCILPEENVREGEYVREIQVTGCRTLSELLLFCSTGQLERETPQTCAPELGRAEPSSKGKPDFGEIAGQSAARRAALVSASGFHNLLMLGPPGSGKSMIARRMPSILPPLSEEESLEVTRIYSIAGLLPREQPLMRSRPFRSPHHTISPQAMAGGGRIPAPGEITLAHRGVLFFDELPEASRRTLEVLRQPMEERRIVISRVNGSYVFPASFLFVAAMNLCPCGNYPDLNRCTCTPADISRYLSRVSQPLLDRMELCVQVEAVSYQELTKGEGGMTSREMREKVEAAHALQRERYRRETIRFNNELTPELIRRYCPLTGEAERLLASAFSRLGLSARAYHGIIRTARTIADLDGADRLGSAHISEAICCRSADKKIWRV